MLQIVQLSAKNKQSLYQDHRNFVMYGNLNFIQNQFHFRSHNNKMLIGKRDFLCWAMMALMLIKINSQINYVTNGGFQFPVLTTVNGNKIDGWNGTKFDAKNDPSFNLGFGQYCDLQKAIYQNGYISQIINLPFSGSYNLSYYQRARTTNYFYYELQIYWNQVLQCRKSPNTTSVTHQNLILKGIMGKNSLKFVQVGNDTDVHGTYIDQVMLVLVEVEIVHDFNAKINYDIEKDGNAKNLNLKQQILHYIGVLISIVFSHSTSAKFAFVFLQDLWLFAYDCRDYKGIINETFELVAQLEKLKFQFLQKWLNLMQKLKPLPFSNYNIDQDQSSKVFSQTVIEILLPYFIYTIPERTFLCITLYVLYHIVKKFSISRCIVRYQNFWSNIIQTYLQGEISFFAFISQANFQASFSFHIWDRGSLIITLLFFFILLMFATCFYLLLNQFYPKNCFEFITYLNKNNSSFFFLTSINMVRGLLRGIIFFYLYHYYEYQIISLCVIQIFIVSILLALEKGTKLFRSQLMFCLSMLYQIIFLLFNICLILDYKAEQSGLYQVQNILSTNQQKLLFILIVITIFRMILDFIPLQNFKDCYQKENKMPSKKKQNLHQSNQLGIINGKLRGVAKVTIFNKAQRAEIKNNNFDIIFEE